MIKFEKLIDNIYRLCVPFEDIYTSAFVLKAENDCIIIDNGSNEADVKNYVFSAICDMNFTPTWIIGSHSHGNHNGGMSTLSKLFSGTKIGLFDESKKFVGRI